MYIAVFTDTFIPKINGVVSSTVSLLYGLARRHDVIVFAPRPQHIPKNPFGPRVSIEWVRGFVMPTYPEVIICYPPTRRARKAFIGRRPDLIIIVTAGGIGLAGKRLAKSMAIPSIGISHTFLAHYLRHVLIPQTKYTTKVVERGLAVFYGSCDHVVAPTRSMARALRSWGVRAPIKVISNPVDTKRFRPGSHESASRRYKLGPHVVVHCGRLSYEKNVEAVLRGFATIHARMPDAQLLIIGDGPQRAALEKLARNLGIARKTIFTGYKNGEELTELIRTGTVFCTASESESQGIVVLESFASGVPVVAYKSLGVGDTVQNGVNGLTVRPGSTAALGAALLRILSSPRLRRRLSEGALRTSRAASDPAVQRTWLALATAVARKKTRR